MKKTETVRQEALRKVKMLVETESQKHPKGMTLNMFIKLINQNAKCNAELYAFRNDVRFIPILSKKEN